MSLWRVSKGGQDYFIRRFTEDGTAWKVYERFSTHPAALSRKRTYYLLDVGTTFSGSVQQTVRDRPAMYIGDTSESGVLHMILEVISNSADQFLQGQATEVRVKVSGHSFVVEDDGAGFHRSKAKHIHTNYHNTATADDHAPHIHLSSHGIGVCPVNALCSSFVVESFDQGGGWRLAYAEGALVEELSCGRQRGTLTRGVLDDSIFDVEIPLGALRRKCFDAVHLLPGLKISVNEETYHAPGGLLALADFEAGSRGGANCYQTTSDRFGYIYDGEALSFSIACLGQSDKETEIHSWVNGGRTPGHGTHVDGALEALEAVNWVPAVVTLSVVMKEPEYAGPTKDRLGTKKVKSIVRDALEPRLREFGPTVDLSSGCFLLGRVVTNGRPS